MCLKKLKESKSEEEYVDTIKVFLDYIIKVIEGIQKYYGKNTFIKLEKLKFLYPNN
jgi:hypothetical protein